jgi:hypothetical protein
VANTANYAQISETLIDHPKTTRAIRMLRMNRMQFVGHLVALWNWALKNAADGDLSRFTPRDIADAARFTDPDDFEEQADIDAQRFVQALTDCQTADGGSGFLEVIDGELLIHDWEDFGGKLHAKREANKERMKAARAGASPQKTPPPSPRATHVQNTTDAHGAHPYRRGEERREEKSVVFDNRRAEVPAAQASATATSQLEAILQEADGDPRRSHWRSSLEALLVAEASRIRHRAPYALATVQAWLEGRDAPPVPSAQGSARKLTATEQKNAETVERLETLRPALTDATARKYAHLVTDTAALEGAAA